MTKLFGASLGSVLTVCLPILQLPLCKFGNEDAVEESDKCCHSLGWSDAVTGEHLAPTQDRDVTESLAVASGRDRLV